MRGRTDEQSVRSFLICGKGVEFMEQKKNGPGVFGLIALGTVLCLSLALTGDRARAAAAAAPAVVEAPRQTAVQTAPGQVGRTVIPLGKAVGIKLFSDGVPGCEGSAFPE